MTECATPAHTQKSNSIGTFPFIAILLIVCVHSSNAESFAVLTLYITSGMYTSFIVKESFFFVFVFFVFLVENLSTLAEPS
jgi:hypothetical protein